MKTRMTRVVGMVLAGLLASGGVWGGEAVRFEDGKGLVAPKIVKKAAPAYPEECRKERVTGRVVLEAKIGVDGKVSDVKVLEGADPRLDAAAAEAVKAWRYKPARDENRKPVEVLYRVTVQFELH